MATKSCNYCQASIDFAQTAQGRWRPVDAGTQNWHRCKLEQKCGVCGGVFEGAPWMDKCPQCFKDSKPSRRGFKPPAETGNFGDQPARSTSRYDTKVYPPRKSEALEADDGFDDIPF